jgi:hypothetical protein
LLVITQAVLFGFWLTLPFTKFRVASVGFSEVFGVLAVALVACAVRIAFKGLSLALFSVHVLICVFTAVRVLGGEGDFGGALRDMVAVSYSMIVAIAIVNLYAAERSLLLFSSVGIRFSIYLSMLAMLFSIASPGAIDVWFAPTADDVAELVVSEGQSIFPRFVGFSTNPNQFAFYIVFAMFFCLMINFRIEKIFGSVEAAVFIVSCLVLLIATQSDAALLAVAAGAFFLVARRYFFNGGPVSAVSGYLAACFAGSAVSLLWAWGLGDDSGNGRLVIWLDAIEVVDKANGLGLGYGAHVPGDFGHYHETHSFLLDFLVFGGVIGGLFLVFIVFLHLRVIFSSADSWLVVASFAALVFCLTYSPFRHPIFWIALILPFSLRRELALGIRDA